jgi:hypothetical protein
VADEPPEKKRHDLAEATCRVVMDVRIRVREITPESVADEFTPDEGLTWEWAERQGRLLRALVRDHEAFNRYLIGVAKDDLGELLDSSHIKRMPADEEDDLLEGVYSGMGDEDTRFFQKARRDGILSDNIPLFHTSFITDWPSTRLVDVSLTGTQDGRTEIS